MKKYFVLLVGLLAMVLFTVLFTKMTTIQTQKLNPDKTYHKNTNRQKDKTTSEETANVDSTAESSSDKLSAEEMQQIVNNLTAMDSRIDESAAYWLCDHYPTGASTVASMPQTSTPDELDALWQKQTGRTLPQLLEER